MPRSFAMQARGLQVVVGRGREGCGEEGKEKGLAEEGFFGRRDGLVFESKDFGIREPCDLKGCSWKRRARSCLF